MIKEFGKSAKRVILFLGISIIVGFLFQSCATGRKSCDCNNLNTRYKPPKSYKRNIN